MKESTLLVNGQKLFRLSNEKESDVSICIVHGYAEHIKRYDFFYNLLDDCGYRVMGYDHRGHGQSEGKRAIIDSFDTYVEDLHTLTQSFFQKGKKNFLVAHSMGGLIAILYLQKYRENDITGVITSGAALKMYDKTQAILEKLASTIARILPSLPTVPVKPHVVSRDPEIVEKYTSDPLNYTKPTKAKMGSEFLKAQKQAYSNLSSIVTPLFINHGSSDLLIHSDSSKDLYDKVASSDKTLKIWDGLYHELLNEPEKEEVAKAFIQWIKDRI
jgi:alpha-beta hydrolase superfamily lysophospholipase